MNKKKTIVMIAVFTMIFTVGIAWACYLTDSWQEGDSISGNCASGPYKGETATCYKDGYTWFCGGVNTKQAHGDSMNEAVSKACGLRMSGLE